MSTPTPMQEILPDVVRSQLATCECGAEYVQTKWLGRWVPEQCPKCARAADRAAHAKVAPEVERQRRLERLNIPPEYAHATIDSLRDYSTRVDIARVQRIRRNAKDWLEAYKRDRLNCAQLLIFRGRWGTGKTHVAYAIARHLVLEHDADVHVTKLADMVRRIRAAWNEDSESEQRILAQLHLHDLLVIDEASEHAMYGIENVRQHLYDVLDFRLNWRRPTIITTNESIEDFWVKVFGPALSSRTHQHGEIWEFGADDATDFRVWHGSQRERKDLA